MLKMQTVCIFMLCTSSLGWHWDDSTGLLCCLFLRTLLAEWLHLLDSLWRFHHKSDGEENSFIFKRQLQVIRLPFSCVFNCVFGHCLSLQLLHIAKEISKKKPDFDLLLSWTFLPHLIKWICWSAYWWLGIHWTIVLWQSSEYVPLGNGALLPFCTDIAWKWGIFRQRSAESWEEKLNGTQLFAEKHPSVNFTVNAKTCTRSNSRLLFNHYAYWPHYLLSTDWCENAWRGYVSFWVTARCTLSLALSFPISVLTRSQHRWRPR